MNKKFLSAILFGALMATSAGTFVSCKDYDDDIKNLQTQIDTNKTAIAELQKLVGAGNWVTNVAASGESLVVTMSNGTSATIAGIKGADGKDGKNAAEWTIGEDGFWYVNGEKTANVAVAKNGENGKNGATAPSPSISENGMWVVYSWDEAKGEFVAEETEIPAAGTSAYAVKANGIYTLYIADENGEMQEIALPATAGSFMVNAIKVDADFVASFSYGVWKTPTNKTQKEMFDKLAAEFPALKEYKDKQLVTQGNKLPFIVSPANMQFTEDHSFALVDSKGNDSGATLSNPTAGMPENVALITRAAEGSAVWSVEYLPALNKKGTDYLNPASTTAAYALVVSGPNGVASATPFAYSYSVTKAGDNLNLDDANTAHKVSLSPSGFEYRITKDYNENGIDIFAATTEDPDKITLPAEVLNGKFILEATDPAQVEEYGISIDGSVVTVADMPKGKSIAEANGIKLKLTAISVNGSVDNFTFKLGVDNAIAATGALADMEVTLTGNLDKNGKYVNASQVIYWSLDKLELTAMQKRSLVDATTTKKLHVYRTDVDAQNQEVEVAIINNAAFTTFYNANKVATTDYTKIAYIAGTINVADGNVIPENYNVVLTAEAADGTTILKAESELTLVNPEEDLLPIKKSVLDENGVVLAVAYAPNYTFVLDNPTVGIFDKIAGTQVESFVDLDRAYDSNTYKLWWTDGTNKIIGQGNTQMLGTLKNGEYVATEVDKIHTFKVTYKLFNNPNNKLEKEIKVKWTSPIYAEKASDVISMTAAKLKIKFDDTTPTATNANKINFKAITSAIWAQGSLKGQAYDLFGTAAGDDEYTTYTYTDYTNASYEVMALSGVNYMKSTDEQFVDIRLEDMLALGYSAANLQNAQADGAWKLKESDFTTLYTAVMSGSDKNGKGLMEWYSNNVFDAYRPIATASNITNATLKKQYEMFVYYAGKIKFKNTSTNRVKTADGAEAKPRQAEIYSVNFKLVNAEDQQFIDTTIDATVDRTEGFALTAKASKTINKSALVEGKAIIPMEMVITDKWGKVMTYAFNVEISL